MNRNLTILLFAAIILYIILIISSGAEEIANPEYQTYINEYRENLDLKVEETLENKKDYNLQYKGTSSGSTTGNFEGPQVHLKGIKFHNEYLTSADLGSRLKHIDGVSAHFDPDHAYYGLPDVKISIKDVRLYNPHKSSVAEFLQFGNGKPEPYKVYKKKIVGDPISGKNKYLEMQLWLTEFDVTVDIRPDRNIPVNISNDEQDETTYPGYWYGSGQKELKLNDLDKEHKDFRYGDLSFILEVIPDKSPIYVQTSGGATSKPDFAIGAIYCQKSTFGNEPDVQRISTNVHSGQPLFLNNSPDINQMNTNSYGLSDKMEANAIKLLELRSAEDNFIWNKPYYVKLFFNNLGTWRSGLFNQNQFHDQVSYSFLMPLFVVGSWDVIAPQEVLPAWNPPQQFVKKFTLKNLLPLWNMGWPGKITGLLLLGLMAVIVLVIIFPPLLPLIGRMISLPLRRHNAKKN